MFFRHSHTSWETLSNPIKCNGVNCIFPFTSGWWNIYAFHFSTDFFSDGWELEWLATSDHRQQLYGKRSQWATFPHTWPLQTNPWSPDHRRRTPETPLADQNECSGCGWPAENITTEKSRAVKIQHIKLKICFTFLVCLYCCRSTQQFIKWFGNVNGQTSDPGGSLGSNLKNFHPFGWQPNHRSPVSGSTSMLSQSEPTATAWGQDHYNAFIMLSSELHI